MTPAPELRCASPWLPQQRLTGIRQPNAQRRCRRLTIPIVPKSIQGAKKSSPQPILYHFSLLFHAGFCIIKMQTVPLQALSRAAVRKELPNRMPVPFARSKRCKRGGRPRDAARSAGSNPAYTSGVY